MSVPFICIGDNLTLVLKNKSYQVLPDHINYRMILEKLETGTEDELLEIVDVQKAVTVFSQGLVSIKDGRIFYDNEEVHGSISKRILDFMSKGLPFQPLVNFLNNLMQNPSMQSQTELYDFLEHEYLPITEDGHFLAYKAVRSDYMDKYQGIFDNSVGKVCQMTRSKVDDNRSRGCSKGLHAGALNYVAGYGNVDAGDKIVIVKINPKDVVSVPQECNCEKLRTCRYEVVGEYKGELLKPLYNASLECGVDYNDDDDDDYEDVDYDWGWNEDDDEEEAYNDDDDDDDNF
jgi:hypothetical protein